MPRFTDQWVIDRVLFDYMSGGSCACCGISFTQFLPNGTADLIGAVSDLDTDQATKEIHALEHHPWPRELRDQVWSDRVKLRQKLKQTRKVYEQFYLQVGEPFEQWCRDNPVSFKKCLQIPRSEIGTLVSSRYDIHSAFGVVLSTVVEQVACFHLTKYPTDARGDNGEVEFENNLQFSRMSGFTLNVFDEDGAIHEDRLQQWFKRFKSLGGPKLLEKGKSNSNDDDDNDPDGTVTVLSSFQSDRRIVRLLIARYWADLLMQTYHEATSKSLRDKIVY